MKDSNDISPMTVSSRRKVTIDRDLLEYLDVKPGGQIEVYLLPRGRCVMRAARTGDIRDFIGFLAHKPRTVEGDVSIGDMNEAIEKGREGEL
ncbi:AbrB/MazE/SpoVT family DNA-binding domain-containing protein [Roseateles chitinivorans]|uniref:AbrB/MazE/SpoVT family DNA-binding domain-containing protein n=1 Tax=Roseateles chitinivorans TaxID=2917965 RepID=UPI003D679649